LLKGKKILLVNRNSGIKENISDNNGRVFIVINDSNYEGEEG